MFATIKITRNVRNTFDKHQSYDDKNFKGIVLGINLEFEKI